MTKQERERVAVDVIGRLRLCHLGRENAVKGKELIKIMQFDNMGTPELRTVINKARNLGYPIGSSPQDGYWYCENLTEVMEVVKSLETRAKKILVASKKMVKACRGQCEFVY